MPTPLREWSAAAAREPTTHLVARWSIQFSLIQLVTFSALCSQAQVEAEGGSSQQLSAILRGWVESSSPSRPSTASDRLAGAAVPLDFIRKMGAQYVEPSSSLQSQVGKGSPPSPPGVSTHREAPLSEPDDATLPVMDAEAMAKRTWARVKEEKARKSCMEEKMAGLAGFPPDPKLDDLRGLNASGVFDRWRCNRMMFIAIGDDLHKDGYGMMLIRLERLLALGCLTRRTLVLPAKTFKALQSLVDLPALEAAGYCLVPDASPWQDKAKRTWASLMALKVPGMPAKFKFGVPAPGFQSGLPLSNLAERLNRDEFRDSGSIIIPAGRAIATCSSWHDERRFYGQLSPTAEVLAEVRHFQHFWIHRLTLRQPDSPGALTSEEFDDVVRQHHLGAPGSGRFTAVSPAPDRPSCLESAAHNFHIHNGAAVRVAETCWPHSSTVFAVKELVMRGHKTGGSHKEVTFVPHGLADEWRDVFNRQMSNSTADYAKHWIPAVSYDPLCEEQWNRRRKEQHSAEVALQMCKKQQAHDPASVKAGACEALHRSKSANLDKDSLQRVTPYVNFWLLVVAQRFIGSAADPTSVAVANIRAANDKGGAVLEWLPEATGLGWNSTQHMSLHVRQASGEEYWLCEKLCHWCGPEKRSRC